MNRLRRLPTRSLAEVVEAFPTHRQSRLTRFDDCALATRFELEGGGRWQNDAMGRGTLFHRFAGEVLRTLQRTGETRMPVADGLEILYEVSRQRDVPDDEVVVISARARRELRIAAIMLCKDNEFGMRRLMAVERQLQTTLAYPHPDTGEAVERVLTGRPDALLADPATPDDPAQGATVLDFKTNRKAPPPGGPDDHWDDPAHLSYGGYPQLRLYGMLVLRNYPLVERVKLREFYVFEGVARYGTVFRDDLEQLEREWIAQVELLDRALMGGSKSPMWQPSPGKHCAFCVAPTRCPISADERARQAGIATWPEAERAAAQYVVATTIHKDLHEATKAWVNEHGPVNVKSAKGRYQLRWRRNKTGNGRTFGVYVPDDSDRASADPQLEAAFSEARERVTA